MATLLQRVRALPRDRLHACAAAWEMDTVEGARGDSARLLTPLHRPSRFQLALPLPDGACSSVLAAPSSLRGVLGKDGAGRAFGAVLTDNGSEFADEGAIAALLGERDGETRLFYCDPRQSQQKGACEKNHVEIRKLLPKGAGARFDRLTEADCALLTSQVNSEPRGAARVPDAGARAEDGPRGGRLRPHGRVRDRGAGARRARPHVWLHRQGQGREGRGPAGGTAGGPGHGPEGPLRCVRNGCAVGWRSMSRQRGDTGLHSPSTCGNEAMARCRGLFPHCASCGNAGSVQAVALRLKINPLIFVGNDVAPHLTRLKCGLTQTYLPEQLQGTLPDAGPRHESLVEHC